MANRRKVLMLLFSGAAVLPFAAPAFADDGEGSGHGSSGSGGSRNSGGPASGGGNGRGDGGGGTAQGGGGRGDTRTPSTDGSPGRGSGTTVKDENGEGEDGDDDDRIKDWVKKGEAAPLSEILKTVRERYDGKVVNVKLVGKDKPELYKIRIIDQKNNLIEVQVDARKATIVGTAGAGIY